MAPPRAQMARLPASRNGTSASRRAATAFFIEASIAGRGCSMSGEDMRAVYPRAARGIQGS